MNNIKYLIIGGGISGLAFAVRKKNEDYLIIEKSNVLGGLAQSFRSNGFVWDVAGHFFHFHSNDTKRYYEELMRDEKQRAVSKKAYVYYGKKYIDAPFQYHIDQLPTHEFLECLTTLYYANDYASGSSFDDYVREKYGSGIANKFLIPYNEKLYACKMNELEKDSMGCFLPRLSFDTLMSSLSGSAEKTYNDSFLYPVEGCSKFVDALAKQLNPNKIHMNETVVKVDADNQIVYTNIGAYKYEYLINTSSLNTFSELCGVESKGKLDYNRVLVLNIGFDLPSVDKEVNWIYFPGDEVFYRVGFYNNIAGTERLSIYVEISYKEEGEIDIESAFNATLVDLKRVGIIDNHKVIAYNSFVINPGYVHITKKSKDFVSNFVGDMKKRNVFMIGRYAKWEYSAMDDSLEQALELSKRI